MLISEVRTFLEEIKIQQFENELVIFERRYQAIKKESRVNGTHPEDLNRRRNLLYHNILEMLDELQSAAISKLEERDHGIELQKTNELAPTTNQSPPNPLPNSEALETEAQAWITNTCLIAADVDKTYIEQSDDPKLDRQRYLSDIAPSLVEAAKLGTNLAVVTGNSMHSLTERFLRWTIVALCRSDAINQIGRFYFFCNSGGVFAHIPSTDEKIVRLEGEGRTNASAIFESLTTLRNDKRAFKSEFIDEAYIKKTRIYTDDVPQIKTILDEVKNIYFLEVTKNLERLRQEYHINHKDDIKELGAETEKKTIYDLYNKHGELSKPSVDERPVEYRDAKGPQEAMVQITLKPMLSFRHALEPQKKFGEDLRTKYIPLIQERLDTMGLSKYIARPGGRSSIDITLEKIDKAYALEFLIDFLNLQGSTRQGLKFGSNAIYIGDEIIVGGGNDYAVTKIPGLLVFAVNFDQKLIPMLSKVMVPHTKSTGPKATKKVLKEYIDIAEELISTYKWSAAKKGGPIMTKNAIHAFKEKYFLKRIKDKVNSSLSKEVSVDDLQTLHAFITMIYREDPAASKWISILMNELDSIMTHISVEENHMAYGTSHEDEGFDF